MEKSRRYMKQYYSCYPFLFQIAALWMNHFMLAQGEGRQREILEEARQLRGAQGFEVEFQRPEDARRFAQIFPEGRQKDATLLLLVILFLLLGIMNPAAAKLTPWLLETMSESMAQTGLHVTAVEVDALSSWTQFYKNAPMAMIAFLLIFGGILSGEYQRGTLVHMVTKGLSRWKILAAKALALLFIWSGAYWLMYLVTYAYTVYFWDNSAISHCAFAAFCAYIAGLWLISLLLLGSVLFRSMGGALGLAAACAAVSYLCGILPAVSKYAPTSLLSPLALLTGGADVSELLITVLVTLALAAAHMAAAVMCIKKRAI